MKVIQWRGIFGMPSWLVGDSDRGSAQLVYLSPSSGLVCAAHYDACEHVGAVAHYRRFGR